MHDYQLNKTAKEAAQKEAATAKAAGHHFDKKTGLWHDPKTGKVTAQGPVSVVKRPQVRGMQHWRQGDPAVNK